ncbi:MAG: neuromedin U [Candidatus Korobacteraceae bacterium]
MREKLFKAVLMLVALMVLPGLAWSQDAPQNLTLIVAGQPGQIPIVQINGKSYVDIDALARLTNSSLSFKGNQVILTPSGSAVSTTPAAPEPSVPAGHLKLVATEGQPADPEASIPPEQTKQVATGEKPATPESEESKTAALAKAAQNPVANLISFPLQNNTNFGIGPYERAQNVLNIQPVIPFHISEKWNLITRTILPVVWQPNDQPTQGWFGFGDLNPSLFLSPAKPGKLIWGVGPALVLPTATAEQLGQGRFSLGPSVVVLSTPGHWVLGALINNVWSVAGPHERAVVNQMLLQWFVNYNMKKGWYFTTSPIITADWRAPSGNQAVVPFGGGMGRIMKIGFQPVNITGQFYGNAVHPAGASPWSMRLQIQFLFPQFTKAQEKEMLEMKLKQMDQEQQAPQPKK